VDRHGNDVVGLYTGAYISNRGLASL